MFDLSGLVRCLRLGVTIGTIVSLLSVVCSSASGQGVNFKGSGIIYPAGLSPQQVLDGWIALLDGESPLGWTDGKSKQLDANLSDGRLVCDARRSTAMLRTTTQFDDFHLKLEFKLESGADASLFVRTSPQPREGLKDCCQIKLAAGSKFKEKPRAGIWHRLSVIASGRRVQSALDGIPMPEAYDSELGRGYIGLRADVGKASFRNITLKPIVDDDLLTDKDLAAWSTDRSEDSTFAVNADGELQVSGGRGQLESKEQFADFVLSLQCKTNENGLNSGIFFRCIPGDFMNGYESQIQNIFKARDRSAPVDCGTGGIFRRVNARLVNADDRVWFAKTIIATGPRVGVWVNGYQVTDWVDRRKPNENPRRGLRLKEGTIAIQGHDPTTDILFREIKVRELSPRRPGK